MSEKVYNRFKQRSSAGLTVWGTSTIKMLLLKTSAAGAYDPDVATVSALLAVGSVAETTATNYARTALGTFSDTQDDVNDRANLDAADVVFANLGVAAGTDGSIVAAVIYDEGGGTDATRYLISYHDTGFPVVTNGQNFTVATPSDILRLT